MTPTTPDLLAAGGGSGPSAGVAFEAYVGAYFSALILSHRQLPSNLRLSAGRPIFVKFETEAPVDDILVSTSEDGFLAIQAKTTVSASPHPQSPFGKAIDQFVRHWVVCRNGVGARGWDRPLDPRIDRLVLAIGPTSSASVRVHLPEALRARLDPGSRIFTDDQRKVLEAFEQAIAEAWRSISSEAQPDELLDDLCKLTSILVFDPAGRDLEHLLAGIVEDGDAASTALLQVLMIDWMRRRRGGDHDLIRAEWVSRGARLPIPPQYREDQQKLHRYSEAVARSLKQFEYIEPSAGVQINVPRDCQAAVEQAAEEGSLLIIGEPGAGKSGVLSALAANFRASGRNVVELAVDRFSIESEDGLRAALQLQHPLIEVLKAQDGESPSWLVIDALDAARGGRGEHVFRTLIDQVVTETKNWRVVATIRSFDLRMGQRFKELFKGRPPQKKLSNAAFEQVRHVEIPEWSSAEFANLLDQAGSLKALLEDAPEKLQDLARVPFNTRLLAELIASGQDQLSDIETQVGLLARYWSHRVETQGLPATPVLRKIVQSMVAEQSLQAAIGAFDVVESAVLERLQQEGILLTVDNGRRVQFRHHLLFDYAASRLYFDPQQLLSRPTSFPKGNAPGLMLAPGLQFLLHEMWSSELDHFRYWRGASILATDAEADPVLRGVAARSAATLPVTADSIEALARQVAEYPEAEAALKPFVGALAVRLEDDAETPVAPWTRLAARLAELPNGVPYGHLHTLVYYLSLKELTGDLRDELGRAARVLLLDALDGDMRATGPIGFVAETFDTDPAASKALFRRLFQSKRFADHGWEDIPALTRKIKEISASDGRFAVEVYRGVFRDKISEDIETSLGSSQIMALKSNARQDFGMARFALTEHFPTFFRENPRCATDAIVEAVDGYIQRDHPRSDDVVPKTFSVSGRSYRLVEDLSFIWAHRPDEAYGHDGDALLVKFLQVLRDAPDAIVEATVKQLLDRIAYAVFWSRLFMIGAERGGTLSDLLWTFASQEVLLVSPDTRKDAVDLVSAAIERRTPDERSNFELKALGFDFSEFKYPDLAAEGFRSRLFGAIGIDRLVTDQAREALSKARQAKVDAGEPDEEVGNKRLYEITTSGGIAEGYYWIPDLDHTDPGNAALIAAIDPIRDRLGLQPNDNGERPPLDVPAALLDLEALRDLLERHRDANFHLKAYAEGTIGQGLARIVEALPADLSASAADQDVVQRCVTLLRVAAASAKPVPSPEAETSFAESPSWSSPAPRVEAAQVAPALLVKRPALRDQLWPTYLGLISDPHPAVRTQATTRLVNFWSVDPAAMWEQLEQRVTAETNPAVANYLASGCLRNLVHVEPDRIADLVLTLLRRFGHDDTREGLVNEIATILSILWVRYAHAGAQDAIRAWVDDPVGAQSAIQRLIMSLRSAVVVGLAGEAGTEDKQLRHRAQELVLSAVDRSIEFLKLIDFQHTNETEAEAAKACFGILDAACRELYFGIGGGSSDAAASISLAGQKVLLHELEPLIKRLGDWGVPHTIYYLLQILEQFVDVEPALTFDLVANALLKGGRQAGYEFESLGADLSVRLIGVFLADHKEIFTPDRRRVLVDCLEIFIQAGWPSARRLLYRLPELMQ